MSVLHSASRAVPFAHRGADDETSDEDEVSMSSVAAPRIAAVDTNDTGDGQSGVYYPSSRRSTMKSPVSSLKGRRQSRDLLSPPEDDTTASSVHVRFAEDSVSSDTSLENVARAPAVDTTNATVIERRATGLPQHDPIAQVALPENDETVKFYRNMVVQLAYTLQATVRNNQQVDHKASNGVRKARKSHKPRQIAQEDIARVIDSYDLLIEGVTSLIEGSAKSETPSKLFEETNHRILALFQEFCSCVHKHLGGQAPNSLTEQHTTRTLTHWLAHAHLDEAGDEDAKSAARMIRLGGTTPAVEAGLRRSYTSLYAQHTTNTAHGCPSTTLSQLPNVFSYDPSSVTEYTQIVHLLGMLRMTIDTLQQTKQEIIDKLSRPQLWTMPYVHTTINSASTASPDSVRPAGDSDAAKRTGRVRTVSDMRDRRWDDRRRATQLSVVLDQNSNTFKEREQQRSEIEKAIEPSIMYMCKMATGSISASMYKIVYNVVTGFIDRKNLCVAHYHIDE